jgi:hypothetical protein
VKILAGVFTEEKKSKPVKKREEELIERESSYTLLFPQPKESLLTIPVSPMWPDTCQLLLKSLQETSSSGETPVEHEGSLLSSHPPTPLAKAPLLGSPAPSTW